MPYWKPLLIGRVHKIPTVQSLSEIPQKYPVKIINSLLVMDFEMMLNGMVFQVPFCWNPPTNVNVNSAVFYTFFQDMYLTFGLPNSFCRMQYH